MAPRSRRPERHLTPAPHWLLHGAEGSPPQVLDAGEGALFILTHLHGIADHVGNQDRSKPALHLMAMYGFDHIRRLLQPTPYPSTRLTPREREVISWASQGKSAWEIGEILHITQRTAEEHLATAARKLGAVNRTHAVALAIRNKIINP